MFFMKISCVLGLLSLLARELDAAKSWDPSWSQRSPSRYGGSDSFRLPPPMLSGGSSGSRKAPFDLDIKEAFMTDLNNDPSVKTVVAGVERPPWAFSNPLSRTFPGQSNPGPNWGGPVILENDQVASMMARKVQCGFCVTNMTVGTTGHIASPNYPLEYGANVDCLWLLGSVPDARITLRCDTIELEPCGVAGGMAPNWRDHLIISPMWTFKKSWVYCGHATTVTALIHTSLCDKMAVTFRSNDNEHRYKGFHCTYTVI